MRTAARQNSLASRLAVAGALVWIGLLSLIVLREVPQPSKDVAVYLESATVWPTGQPTLTASIYGGRYLTVAYYGLFLKMFGASGDSLSIALAVLFAVNGVLTLLACFIAVRSWTYAAAIAAIVTLASCCLRWWYMPLTEAPFMTANTLLLLLWLWYATRPPERRSRSLAALAGIGLLAGGCTHIRQGNVVFIAGVCLSLLVCGCLLPHSPAGSVRGWRSLAACGAVLGAFFVGASASEAGWRAWTGTPRPVQLQVPSVFRRTIEHCGHAQNGPVTARLLRDMHAMSEYVDYHGLRAYLLRTYDPTETNRLVQAVAIETLSACGARTVRRTVDAVVEYLTMPMYRSRAFRLSTDEKFVTLRQGLVKADQLRAEEYVQHGIQAWAPTAYVADRQLSAIAAFRRVFPDVRYVVDPPGLVFVAEFLVLCGVWMARQRRLVSMWLPLCVYTYGTIALVAFAQHVTRRLAEPFFPLALLVLLVTPVVLYNVRRQSAGARNGLESQSTVLGAARPTSGG